MRRIGIIEVAELKRDRVAYLGSAYGGYAVPVETVTGEVGLSFGAGEDISFESAIAEDLGATVHIYDPTPGAIEHCRRIIEEFGRQKTRGEMVIHPFGVWSESKVEKFYSPINPAHISHSILNMQKTDEYFEADCLSPTEILERLHLDEVAFVKLNIEGAEYEVVNAMFDSHITPAVICITFDELHSPIDARASERMKALVGRFADESYLPVHIRDCKVTYVRSEQVK